jgi:hypothetical protein
MRSRTRRTPERASTASPFKANPFKRGDVEHQLVGAYVLKK